MSAGADAVAARVRWPDGTTRPDRNGFVTALAVRALRSTGRPVPDRLLDVLASCRRPGGGYGFWPTGGQPGWAPTLGSDSDDTAVMALELHRAGRLTRDETRDLALRTVARHRLVAPPEIGPPWLAPGVFTTWHRPGATSDLVDLTVVVNVLALLAAVDLLHLPGVATSLRLVDDAVAWAGDRRSRWTSLSPFYPEPDELARAAEHAAGCDPSGRLDGLLAVARAARTHAGRGPDAADVVCSSPYGGAVWESPELTATRNGSGLPDRTGHRPGTLPGIRTRRAP